MPAAIHFDLLNGGDKAWGEPSPYFALGRAALAAAVESFALGTAGAGVGATTASLKGGLGSASVRRLVDAGMKVVIFDRVADPAEALAKELGPDTIAVVASSTKGATNLCAHVLAARGELDMNAKVSQYWPEYAQAGKDAALR